MTVLVETILNVFMAISLFDKVLDEVCASSGLSLTESSSSLTKPLLLFCKFRVEQERMG